MQVITDIDSSGKKIIDTNAKRIFNDIPVTPYDIGDLWISGSSTDVKQCIYQRITGSYEESDWELASSFSKTMEGGIECTILNLPNLVKDHSFELQSVGFYDNTSDLGSWEVYSGSACFYSIDSIDVKPSHGNIYIRTDINNQLEQKFNLNLNSNYTFSAYVKLYYSTNGQLTLPRLTIVHNDGTTETIDFDLDTQPSNYDKNFKWQRIYYTFTTKDIENVTSIILGSNSYIENHFVFWDGIQVVEGDFPCLYNPEAQLWYYINNSLKKKYDRHIYPMSSWIRADVTDNGSFYSVLITNISGNYVTIDISNLSSLEIFDNIGIGARIRTNGTKYGVITSYDNINHLITAYFIDIPSIGFISLEYSTAYSPQGFPTSLRNIFLDSVVLPTNTTIGNVSSTELGYLDGVTSPIQTQINAKFNTTDLATQLLSKIYPVGSIYMSVVNTSPASFLGGTWTALQNRFLVGAGGTYAVNATGGTSTETLTTTQIPSHDHFTTTDTHAGALSMDTTSGAEAFAANGTAAYRRTQYLSAQKTSTTGGGGSHNNLPPYLAVYMWKRTA